MDMRGLAHFIQDIRKVTSNKDEEQKRIDVELGKIRAKFKESASLSTYDRRKYVCKLMFISMLGYKVSFGHMEGVQLLAMQGAAEKLIGYLCLTVFLHEGHEVMTLTTHIVHMDLQSGKDLNTSLALTAIANTGGRDFCEVMAQSVLAVLEKSPVLQLRKKALLTYLRVWRKYREVVDLTSAVPIAVNWINHAQFGVAAAAITFLTGVIQEKDAHPELFAAIPTAVIKLLSKIILDKLTEPEYIYYGVPAPWLQAKALRLLQYFPVPDEPDRSQIYSIISKITKATDKVVRDAQSLQKQRGTANRSNAMNCALVEITSLLINWGTPDSAKLLGECADVVSNFITDKKDANLRYMGLLLLSRLSHVVPQATGFDFPAHCKQFQSQISVSLHDPDVSLRKRALMLTYSMCTSQNADELVNDLVRFISATQGGFRRDLVLVVVALAEKFATDVGWYVDIVLAVISAAGDDDNVVPDDVWHRLVQVVISDADVQKHAVEKVFQLLSAQSSTSSAASPNTTAAASGGSVGSMSSNPVVCPETMVKIAAVLLGEFGYQIALNSNSSPMDQVIAIQSKFAYVSSGTKAMLLTTLVKFYNLFDSAVVRKRVVKILESYAGHVDSELQQRAAEYLTLIRRASDAVLQAALEPLPASDFQLGRIFTLLDASATAPGGKKGTFGDGVTSEDMWAKKDRERDEKQASDALLSMTIEERHHRLRQGDATNTDAVIPNHTQVVAASAATPTQTQVHVDPASTTEVTEISVPKPATSTPVSAGADIFESLFGGGASLSSSAASSASTAGSHPQPSPQRLVEWFEALRPSNTSGLLYEDTLVSVEVTKEYRNADVRMSLRVKAKQIPLESVSAKLLSTSASLLVQSRDHATTVKANEFITIEFAARCLAAYTDPPTIRFAYSASVIPPRSVVLCLPIVSYAFTAPYRVEDVTKALALWNNTPVSDAPVERTWRATKLLEMSEVAVLLRRLMLFTVDLLPDSILGIGAHATQPAATTQFSPLLVKVSLLPGGQVIVHVKNPSAPLQSIVGDVITKALGGPASNTSL